MYDQQRNSGALVNTVSLSPRGFVEGVQYGAAHGLPSDRSSRGLVLTPYLQLPVPSQVKQASDMWMLWKATPWASYRKVSHRPFSQEDIERDIVWELMHSAVGTRG